MTSPDQPITVALADTRWVGHHPTYLREFTASLLRLGARVLLICQKPDEITGSLSGMELVETGVHGHRLVHRNQGLIRPHRDHDPLSTLLRWRATGKALRAAEAASGWRADFVFFCYLDSYLRFAPFPTLPGRLLGRPWSGLYFRNSHLDRRQPGSQDLLRLVAKGDRILASQDCRAVCVLDERFSDALAALSGKPVIPFPDMTDETPPELDNPLALRILAKACGRKIIGLISMERRKGLLTLLHCAIRAHEMGEPWFFVATGPLMRDTFSPEELEFCKDVARRAESGDLPNLHFELDGGRIPDGAPYNSVFATFDLIWAAYEGFEGSSNALTKAAVFRKPVLATSGECIGMRVERYKLGRTFPEGDVIASLQAIRNVRAEDPESYGFGDYRRLHSRERLDTVFRGLLKPEIPHDL